jgi:hypothetical protein
LSKLRAFRGHAAVDWAALSVNPTLVWEQVANNPNLPWRHDLLGRFPELTSLPVTFVLHGYRALSASGHPRLVAAYPQGDWDFAQLSANRNIGLTTILDHVSWCICGAIELTRNRSPIADGTGVF